MSAMPGPIPGSHTASHEPTRVCTLTIHDVTHLPLCASTGGGLGAIPSPHFLPLPSTTSSMTPRVVQTQSFSTSATSTSPPREASYIRRRQTALQLPQSELYEFTTFYSERRTPTRSIGTPAQRVRHLPHWALFTRRPLTSTSSLREAPSSLNAFPIENEHRATTRYFEKPSSSSGRRHWHPSLSFQATQDT